MHVFPGMEQYATPEPSDFWHTSSKHPNVQHFVSIINKYRNTISLMSAAHIHNFEFRNTKDSLYPNMHVPLMITPSITPIFMNNPMY